VGTLSYRPEIDGLRAVAVIPVVLYHLSPEWIPGGFMGVDVFFVISGFLITSIVLRESAAGAFRLANFWMRRVRRLFPALAVLLLATLLLGYFILYEAEWRALGSQLTAVLLLTGNIHMWKETGDYWGSAADDIPLLHTWSLALEEQFYLIFPVLMVVLLRIGRKSVVPILLAGALASLAYCVVATGSAPATAFYLLPARAWELLVGCLLATATYRVPERFSRHRWAGALSLVGLLMLVASYFLIRSGAGFPGYKALMPTIGTLLVLACTGPGRGVVGSFLSTRPLVFVGRISYSLYLWHWPIIVFWRLHTMEDVSSPRHAIPIFLASLAAASLSWHFVEKPFRRPAFPLVSPKSAVLGASFVVFIGLSLALSQGRLPDRPDPVIAVPPFTAQDYNAERDEVWKSGGVRIGSAPPEIVVIGSSHAIVYGSTIAELASRHDQSVAFLCIGNAFGRFHTDGDDTIFRDGIAGHRAAFDRARRGYLESWQPRQIVWIGRWDNQYELLGPSEFDRIMRASLGIILGPAERVLLLTQPPFSMERPGSVVRFANTLQRQGRPLVGREDPERTALRAAANDAIRAICQDLSRVDLVEVADLFELEDGGVRILAEGGKLLYHDDNHLSDHGARMARERLSRAMEVPLNDE
jgi:peptidoglycan/LPS O-acetylase OafA/YrhL